MTKEGANIRAISAVICILCGIYLLNLAADIGGGWRFIGGFLSLAVGFWRMYEAVRFHGEQKEKKP